MSQFIFWGEHVAIKVIDFLSTSSKWSINCLQIYNPQRGVSISWTIISLLSSRMDFYQREKVSNNCQWMKIINSYTMIWLTIRFRLKPPLYYLQVYTDITINWWHRSLSSGCTELQAISNKTNHPFSGGDIRGERTLCGRNHTGHR